jgi:transcription elongation GreA/GreB family factor
MLKEIVILDDDKAFARTRITELEKEILSLGPEFYEVFNQSSETWHDNAPFDALRDRQSLLDAELQQLRHTLRRSALSTPKPKKNTVGYGSVVQLENGNSYFIAGDWTPHAGQMKNGAIVVSSNAPIALQLFGKKVGSEVHVGRISSCIASIQSTHTKSL